MPYPITGSDPANMEARLYGSYGTAARLGSTRLGYHDPRVVLRIAGTDRSAIVEKPSLRIDMRLGEPSTATFRLIGYQPTVGQEVTIGTGSQTNKFFGGHIIQINHLAEGVKSNLRYDVTCQDYQYLLGKELVYDTYTSRTAFDVVTLLLGYTTGFTLEMGQDLQLTVLDEVVADYEPLNSVLSRVADLLSCSWYVDDAKVVHFFTTDNTPVPVALNDSNSGFEQVDYSTDLTQVRTYVLVRGLSVGVLQALRVNEDMIPVADQSVFESAGYVSVGFGGGVLAVAGVNARPNWSSTLFTAASAGASSLVVSFAADNFNSGGGWLEAAGQIVRYSSLTGAATINLTYTTGDGSLTAGLEVGTVIRNVPFVELTNFITTAVESGGPCQIVASAEDTTAQTAIAALDGSDGVRMMVITDSTLGYAGALARAEAEVAAYKDPQKQLTYRTKDPTTIPGQLITATISGFSLSAVTFRIQSVSLSEFELGTDLHPWRSVTAEAKRNTLFSVWAKD